MPISCDGCCMYNTLKTVRIRDRRLGCIYYLLVLGVLAYILTILITESTYLKYDDALGSLRLLLTHYNHATNISSLPYCKANENIGCLVMDEHDVRYPDIDTNQLLLTTYIKETHETRNPKCSSEPCNPNEVFKVAHKYEYYIPEAEKYDLHISASAKSPEFCSSSADCEYASTTARSPGHMTFKRKDGTTETVHFPQNTSDTIPLSDILEAAGLDMDKPLPGQTTSKENIRKSGAVVFIDVTFTNVQKCSFLSPCNISYYYTVQSGEDVEIIYDSKLDLDESQWMGNASRTVLTRSGIKMVFSVSGSFGKFDFQTFLVTLTTAFGLLAGTTLFVDALAIYILPQRQMYSDWKYEEQVNRDDSLQIPGLSAAVTGLSNVSSRFWPLRDAPANVQDQPREVNTPADI